MTPYFWSFCFCMQHSNGYSNVYHSCETLLLFNFLYLMVKLRKLFVEIGSPFKIALFFLSYQNFLPPFFLCQSRPPTFLILYNAPPSLLLAFPLIYLGPKSICDGAVCNLQLNSLKILNQSESRNSSRRKFKYLVLLFWYGDERCWSNKVRTEQLTIYNLASVTNNL